MRADRLLLHDSRLFLLPCVLFATLCLLTRSCVHTLYAGIRAMCSSRAFQVRCLFETTIDTSQSHNHTMQLAARMQRRNSRFNVSKQSQHVLF